MILPVGRGLERDIHFEGKQEESQCMTKMEEKRLGKFIFRSRKTRRK